MNDLHFGQHKSGMVSARSGLLEFSLRYDKAKLDAELAELASLPGTAKKALRRALDRSLLGMRTDIARYIRDIVPLRAKDVRSGLSVKKAAIQGAQWTGSVRVKGGGIPLMRFDVRPNRQTSMKGRLPSKYKALSYLLERGGQRHANTTENGEHTLFVAPVRGKLGVYYRQGKERGKINQVWGPSLQFHVAPDSAREIILRGADLRFRKELAHEIEHLSGGGR